MQLKKIHIQLNNLLKKQKKFIGDKYDYSKIKYINSVTKVCVICPIHGEFWIKPNDHLNGRGCKNCFLEKYTRTTEQFIEKAKEIHSDKYDYSKVEYINSKTKVCIICPIHGEFWQTPNSHIQKIGCPKCNESHLEREIRLFLQEHNINFEQQKRFKWLGLQSLDFYLPDYNIAIECQGRQHFIDESFGENTIEPLNKRQERDFRKFKLCENNNIKILYFSNLNINYPYNVIEDKELLLEQIYTTTKNGE